MARLLLLEDEDDSREILELALTGAGFDVVAVPTSAAGQRALETGAFDLVLADLLLEPKDVTDSVRVVHGLKELAHPAPLGLLTGWPLPAAEIERLDVAFVLSKPCTRDRLVEQLAKTLSVPDLSQSRLETVHAYFAALETHSYQALGELCTDDVVYQLPGTHGLAREVHGRDAFLAFTEETFKVFREPRFEIIRIRALPNHGAMIEYVGSWLDEGQSRSLPGTLMFEFRGERIARICVRVDPELIT